MPRKLQITTISILLFLMAFSSMALAPFAQVFWLSPTPTRIRREPSTPSAARLSKLKAIYRVAQPAKDMTATPGKSKSSLPLEKQAGSSNWIVAIGVLIVAIIVIPLLLKRKEWRGK